LLFCSPTALIVFFYDGFSEPHYRALAVTIVAFFLFLSAWTVTTRLADVEDIFESMLIAWFYNMTVFGATILGVSYADSRFATCFSCGSPSLRWSSAAMSRTTTKGGDANHRRRVWTSRRRCPPDDADALEPPSRATTPGVAGSIR
jgi:hypothetical protein